jgi:hypothetical protein
MISLAFALRTHLVAGLDATNLWQILQVRATTALCMVQARARSRTTW